MAITVAILRAAGLSSDQIVRVIELEESERLLTRREQNRKAKQNQRSRQQISAASADIADIADTKPIIQQTQHSCQQNSADNADIGSPSPSPSASPSSSPLILPLLTTFPPSQSSPPPHGETRARSRPGCRLPDDWQPTFADLDFATSQLGRERTGVEVETFRDYWHAKAGHLAVKLDWSATWRNWVRKALQQARPPPANGHGYHLSTRDQQKAKSDAALAKLRASIERDRAQSGEGSVPDNPRILPFD